MRLELLEGKCAAWAEYFYKPGSINQPAVLTTLHLPFLTLTISPLTYFKPRTSPTYRSRRVF